MSSVWFLRVLAAPRSTSPISWLAVGKTPRSAQALGLRDFEPKTAWNDVSRVSTNLVVPLSFAEPLDEVTVRCWMPGQTFDVRWLRRLQSRHRGVSWVASFRRGHPVQDV